MYLDKDYIIFGKFLITSLFQVYASYCREVHLPRKVEKNAILSFYFGNHYSPG